MCRERRYPARHGGPAWREVEATRDRLLREIAEKGGPRRNRPVDQFGERHGGQFAGSSITLKLHRMHIRNHISPCYVSLHLDACVCDPRDDPDQPATKRRGTTTFLHAS